MASNDTYCTFALTGLADFIAKDLSAKHSEIVALSAETMLKMIELWRTYQSNVATKKDLAASPGAPDSDGYFEVSPRSEEDTDQALNKKSRKSMRDLGNQLKDMEEEGVSVI